MARRETGGEQGCRTGETAGPVVGDRDLHLDKGPGQQEAALCLPVTSSGPISPAVEAPFAPRPYAQNPGLPGSRCGGLSLQGRCGGMALLGVLKTEGEGGSTGGGVGSRAGAGQATSWAEPILPHDGGEGLAGGIAEGPEEAGSRGPGTPRSPSEVGLATRGQLSLLTCCPLAVWPQTKRRTKAEALVPEWTQGTKSPHLAQAGLIPPEETHNQV